MLLLGQLMMVGSSSLLSYHPSLCSEKLVELCVGR